MPWDDSAYAGFSSHDPWLPLNADWRARNVAAQAGDADSLLSLYRSLLALRRQHAALAIGDFALIDSHDNVLAFERQHAGERLLVALNLGDQTRPLTLPKKTDVRDVLASTLSPSTQNSASVRLQPFSGTLAPNEGLVLQLKEQS